MAIEARIQALEDEHTIIRGQLKQTLSSVRDFLLDLNLPAMQEEMSPSEIHEHNESHDQDTPQMAPPMPNNAPFPQMPPMPQMPQMPMPMPAEMPPAPQAMPQPAPQPAPPPPMMPQPPMSQEIPEMVQQQTAEDETIANWPPAQPEESAGQDPHVVAGQDPDEIVAGSPAEMPEMPEDMPEMAARLPEIAEEIPEEADEEMPEEELEEEEMPEMSNEPEPEEAAEDEPEPQDDIPCCEEAPDEPPQPDIQPEPRRQTAASASQMNLLTNLIRWVSAARRDIGNEQLPIFLDVYGIGEEMPVNLRNVILYLAERIAPKPVHREPARDNGRQAELPLGDAAGLPLSAGPTAALPWPGADADTWSRMIMELHGILSLGDAPFAPQQFGYLAQGETEVFTEEIVEEITGEPPAEEITPEEIAETAAAPEATEPAEAPEESLEIEVVKKSKPKAKPKTKAKTKRKPRAKAAPAAESRMARLKLVVPGNGGEEEELSIGEFNLNIGA